MWDDMIYRTLGNTGLRVSEIGIGTEHLDGKPYEVVEEVIQAALAHGIKGGGRLIQARKLIECCEQLEAVCQSGKSEELTVAVDALHSSMEQLADELEHYAQANQSHG